MTSKGPSADCKPSRSKPWAYMGSALSGFDQIMMFQLSRRRLRRQCLPTCHQLRQSQADVENLVSLASVLALTY